MATYHKMHVTKEYFQMLEAGTKRVEFRLMDEKRQVIQAGDFIEFFCQNDSVKTLRLRVAKILTAPTFNTLFSLVPQSLLGTIPKQKQLHDLENFYQEKTSCHEVIALILEDYE